MSSPSDQQKLQENDFLIDRFIGKLLDSEKIDQTEVDSFRALFQEALAVERDKTPKERLFFLAQLYAAERERLDRESIMSEPVLPPLNSDEILLQEIVDEEIVRCSDIPPEKYEEAQIAVRSAVEYVVGTKVNESVIRRLVQNAIIDFCKKEKLIPEVKEFVVPEIPKSVFENEPIVTKDVGIFERSDVQVLKIEHKDKSATRTNEYDVETEPTESFEEDSIRREILDQIKGEKSALATESGMRHPHFFEDSQQPETEFEIERVSQEIVHPLPVSTDVVLNKPKISVLQKIFKPVPAVETPISVVRESPVVEQESFIRSESPEPLVPPKKVLQYAPQEVVTTVPNLQPQQSAPESFKTKTSVLSKKKDEFLEEEEEPMFKTKVSSFSKGGSSEDGSRKPYAGQKKSLAEAMLAEARKADKSKPLSSKAAKNGVLLETIRQSRNFGNQTVQTPTPAPVDIPVPRKISEVRVSEFKNTGDPEKDLAAASNTKMIFDKSVEMSGEAIEKRHEVRSQEKSFFDKFVFEQMSLISGMVKSSNKIESEQLLKIQEDLVKRAHAISDDESQSISSRIAKLDHLFQGERKKYEVENPLVSFRSKSDPIEDLVKPIFAHLEKDVRTSNTKEDLQFKDTLHNALIFKAKQMRETGFDDKSINKALEEAYSKHVNFYLRGVG